MNNDSFMHIGHDHYVCQDYVISDETYMFVALSDGCSTAKSSDWGSRLLANAAYRLYPRTPFEELTMEAVDEASARAIDLELPSECLRATLLLAMAGEKAFDVTVAGDGFVVARKNSGAMTILEHKFSSGAPYYPTYDHEIEGKKRYNQEFGNSQFITITRTTRYDDFGKLEFVGEDSTSLPIEAIYGHKLAKYSFPFAEYDMVAVLSDGFNSFVKKETTATSCRTVAVPLKEIAHELFLFKNYSGAFVQRRCQKAFRSVFKNNGWVNIDDFSIGVIYKGD